MDLFTQENIARAFTEWERRYREEPERFQSEAAKLLKETPESYGEACAPYFLKIIQEVSIVTLDGQDSPAPPSSHTEAI
jgi:hypothetical protein